MTSGLKTLKQIKQAPTANGSDLFVRLAGQFNNLNASTAAIRPLAAILVNDVQVWQGEIYWAQSTPVKNGDTQRFRSIRIPVSRLPSNQITSIKVINLRDNTVSAGQRDMNLYIGEMELAGKVLNANTTQFTASITPTDQASIGNIAPETLEDHAQDGHYQRENGIDVLLDTGTLSYSFSPSVSVPAYTPVPNVTANNFPGFSSFNSAFGTITANLSVRAAPDSTHDQRLTAEQGNALLEYFAEQGGIRVHYCNRFDVIRGGSPRDNDTIVSYLSRVNYAANNVENAFGPNIPFPPGCSANDHPFVTLDPSRSLPLQSANETRQAAKFGYWLTEQNGNHLTLANIIDNWKEEMRQRYLGVESQFMASLRQIPSGATWPVNINANIPGLVQVKLVLNLPSTLDKSSFNRFLDAAGTFLAHNVGTAHGNAESSITIEESSVAEYQAVRAEFERIGFLSADNIHIANKPETLLARTWLAAVKHAHTTDMGDLRPSDITPQFVANAIVARLLNVLPTDLLPKFPWLSNAIREVKLGEHAAALAQRAQIASFGTQNSKYFPEALDNRISITDAEINGAGALAGILQAALAGIGRDVKARNLSFVSLEFTTEGKNADGSALNQQQRTGFPPISVLQWNGQRDGHIPNITADPARQVTLSSVPGANFSYKPITQDVIKSWFIFWKAQFLAQYSDLPSSAEPMILAALRGSGGLIFDIQMTVEESSGRKNLIISLSANPSNRQATSVEAYATAAINQISAVLYNRITGTATDQNRGGLNMSNIKFASVTLYERHAQLKVQDPATASAIPVDMAKALTNNPLFSYNSQQDVSALTFAIGDLGKSLGQSASAIASPVMQKICYRLLEQSLGVDYQAATAVPLQQQDVASITTAIRRAFFQHTAVHLESTNRALYTQRPAASIYAAQRLATQLGMDSTNNKVIKALINPNGLNTQIFVDLPNHGLSIGNVETSVVSANINGTMYYGATPNNAGYVNYPKDKPGSDLFFFIRFPGRQQGYVPRSEGEFFNFYPAKRSQTPTRLGSWVELLESEAARSQLGTLENGAIPALFALLQNEIGDGQTINRAHFNAMFATDTSAARGSSPSWKTYNDGLGTVIENLQTNFDNVYRDYYQAHTGYFELLEAQRVILATGDLGRIDRLPNLPQISLSYRRSQSLHTSALATLNALLTPEERKLVQNAVANLERQYRYALDDSSLHNLKTDAEQRAIDAYNNTISWLRAIPLFGPLIAGIVDEVTGHTKEAGEDFYSFGEQFLFIAGAIAEVIPGGQAVGGLLIAAGSTMGLAHDIPRIISDVKAGKSGLTIGLDSLSIAGDTIGLISGGLGTVAGGLRTTIEVSDDVLASLPEDSELLQDSVKTTNGTTILQTNSVSRAANAAARVVGKIGLVNLAATTTVTFVAAAKTGNWAGFVGNLANVALMTGATHLVGTYTSRLAGSTPENVELTAGNDYQTSDGNTRFSPASGETLGDQTLYRRTHMGDQDQTNYYFRQVQGAQSRMLKLGTQDDLQLLRRSFGELQYGNFDKGGELTGFTTRTITDPLDGARPLVSNYGLVGSVSDDNSPVHVFRQGSDGSRFDGEVYPFDLTNGRTGSALRNELANGNSDYRVTLAADHQPVQVRVNEQYLGVSAADESSPTPYFVESDGMRLGIVLSSTGVPEVKRIVNYSPNGDFLAVDANVSNDTLPDSLPEYRYNDGTKQVEETNVTYYKPDDLNQTWIAESQGHIFTDITTATYRQYAVTLDAQVQTIPVSGVDGLYKVGLGGAIRTAAGNVEVALAQRPEYIVITDTNQRFAARLDSESGAITLYDPASNQTAETTLLFSRFNNGWVLDDRPTFTPEPSIRLFGNDTYHLSKRAIGESVYVQSAIEIKSGEPQWVTPENNYVPRLDPSFGLVKWDFNRSYRINIGGTYHDVILGRDNLFYTLDNTTGSGRRLDYDTSTRTWSEQGPVIQNVEQRRAPQPLRYAPPATGSVNKIIKVSAGATGDVFALSVFLNDNPEARLALRASNDAQQATGNNTKTFVTDALVKLGVSREIANERVKVVTGRTDDRSILRAFGEANTKKSVRNLIVPEGAAHDFIASRWSDQMIEQTRKAWNVDTDAGIPNLVDAAFTRQFFSDNGISIGGQDNAMIIWSRFSGKNGNAHVNYDTSITAVKQLINEGRAAGFNKFVIAGDSNAIRSPESASKYAEFASANSDVYDLTKVWTRANGRFRPREAQMRLWDHIDQTSNRMVHVGPRSGNLESLAYLGQTVRYFQEVGKSAYEFGGSRVANLSEPGQNGNNAYGGKAVDYVPILIDEPPTLTGRGANENRGDFENDRLGRGDVQGTRYEPQDPDTPDSQKFNRGYATSDRGLSGASLNSLRLSLLDVLFELQATADTVNTTYARNRIRVSDPSALTPVLGNSGLFAIGNGTQVSSLQDLPIIDGDRPAYGLLVNNQLYAVRYDAEVNSVRIYDPTSRMAPQYVLQYNPFTDAWEPLVAGPGGNPSDTQVQTASRNAVENKLQRAYRKRQLNGVCFECSAQVALAEGNFSIGDINAFYDSVKLPNDSLGYSDDYRRTMELNGERAPSSGMALASVTESGFVNVRRTVAGNEEYFHTFYLQRTRGGKVMLYNTNEQTLSLALLRHEDFYSIGSTQVFRIDNNAAIPQALNDWVGNIPSGAFIYTPISRVKGLLR